MLNRFMTKKLTLACCFVCTALLTIFVNTVMADTQTRAVTVAPDAEKRSSIHTVDGYANLSEDMTLKETRSMAFANAKRQAVEMAQTYIQSKTKVENFELKLDEVNASAEGAVTILEQKDFGIEKNTRYHVWIKAEVEYSLKPGAQTTTPDGALDPGAPLTVKVWTSKKKYNKGDQIEIYLQGNRDFYARIVDITSDGNIIQLLPNDYRTVNRFKGGKLYKIPDQAQGDHFVLNVAPPYGQDQIVVYASEAPLGQIEAKPLGQGLSVVSGDRKSLAAKTRGIAVSGTGPKMEAGADFYEATWTLSTTP
jgi:hypothetical protein